MICLADSTAAASESAAWVALNAIAGFFVMRVLATLMFHRQAVAWVLGILSVYRVMLWFWFGVTVFFSVILFGAVVATGGTEAFQRRGYIELSLILIQAMLYPAVIFAALQSAFNGYLYGLYRHEETVRSRRQRDHIRRQVRGWHWLHRWHNPLRGVRIDDVIDAICCTPSPQAT